MESLEPCDDIFDNDACTGELAVIGFLLGCKRIMLATFDGKEGISGQLLQALITGIGECPCAFSEAYF